MVGKADNGVTLGAQNFITPSILFSTAFMAAAIQFNDEARFIAKEIGDEVAEWLLAAEFETA
jgi:hypothetical protein